MKLPHFNADESKYKPILKNMFRQTRDSFWHLDLFYDEIRKRVVLNILKKLKINNLPRLLCINLPFLWCSFSRVPFFDVTLKFFFVLKRLLRKALLADAARFLMTFQTISSTEASHLAHMNSLLDNRCMSFSCFLNSSGLWNSCTGEHLWHLQQRTLCLSKTSFLLRVELHLSQTNILELFQFLLASPTLFAKETGLTERYSPTMDLFSELAKGLKDCCATVISHLQDKDRSKKRPARIPSGVYTYCRF